MAMCHILHGIVIDELKKKRIYDIVLLIIYAKDGALVMMKEHSQGEKCSYIPIIKVFFAVAVVGIFLFLILEQFLLPDEREKFQSECRVFEAEWQRVLEDGTRIPIDYPGKLPAERGEVVTIVTTVPQEIMEGEAICFSPVWQNINIYIGDSLRVVYDTKDSRPFGVNSPQRNLFVHLQSSDAGKELKLSFSSDSKYAGDMRTAYIGDVLSIWMFLLHESGIQTMIALFMAFMSLFCIMISVVLKWVYGKMLPLSYLAWTIFLCALWVLSEIDIRQLLIPNISVFTNLTYWCLMVLPLPLNLYMNEIQNSRYKKVYMIPLIYASVMLGVGTLLQVFDIVQFVQQLPYVHIGIAITIIGVIGTITIDVFKKKIYDYFPVAIGAYGLLVTAVLEILLYYMDIGVTLGTVLLIGLMFLLIMAIIKTGQDLLRSEQKKQQAIAARASQAKFLANMSHEIRTPINAVIGMNEMILRETDIDAIQEYARNVQSASTMLLGLVNDILDFSKIESGQLELVEDNYSIAGLIQTEILLLKARANNKAIATKLDIDPYIPMKLYGDELRIKQIVTNVLSNAVKYTQEGSVAFKVFFEWIDNENINLCFSVTDTGVGIRKEDLSKLFDSFKRLEQNKNRNIEGTGLGLNIAKQLVDLMRGTIEVESEYGKGSTFRITIPQKVVERKPMGNLDAALKETGKKENIPKKRFTAPEARVLAVDDNTMNLTVLKGLLKRTKVQLDQAISGKECLALTEEKKYDIILMDHMMPDMDGVETLQCLRKDKDNINKDTIVIALTANAVAGCREMYLEYGFDEYVSKPIEAEKLEKVLAQMLPEELVVFEADQVEASGKTEKIQTELEKKPLQPSEALLEVDRQLGLSYVMDSEELYQEILQAFCEQVEEYLPQLQTCYEERNWTAYAVLAHAIKGNARNIGATAFSEFSKKQEFAAKAEEEKQLIEDYEVYLDMLETLAKKVKRMIES